MSPQPMHSPVALESILAAFADLVGVPIEGDSPNTLEMAFENFAIRVGAHPLNPSLLMVLVEIARLDLHDPGASAGFLLHLHHFNASQRPTDRWLATVEEDASVCLCGEFTLAALDATALHALLCEAIDLAESLEKARLAPVSEKTKPENESES